MKYRQFLNTDIQLSVLGFGTMRHPILYNNEKLIDKKTATASMQYAIDNGINYFDTAWPYHKGESEPFLGEFLKATNQRNKIYIATKLPCFLCHETTDFDKYLNAQLQHLQTETIDFYLLHALDGYRFNKIKELGVIDFMERAKKDGKVRYIGFSYHDKYEAFSPILTAYPFDFVQIQLNYMDENFQAGLQGLKDISEAGMATMIMEPLRGGQLAKKPEGPLKELWDSFNTNLSPQALAFKYLYSKTEINTVLSGMSSFEQTVDNIAIASEESSHVLTEKELTMLEALKAYYIQNMPVNCTACGYCLEGCPKIIPIAAVFKQYNEAHVYKDAENSRKKYSQNIKNKYKADNCIECGKCEAICPQHISIIKDLKTAHTFLTKTE